MALLIEIVFQTYNSQRFITYFEQGSFTRSSYITVKYKSIELPFSLRYYIFLNEHSKLFLEGTGIIDLPTVNSFVDVPDLEYFKISSKYNLGIGFGYKLYNKYSLEVRYQTGRDVLKNYIHWVSDYRTLGFIFGYTLN